MDMKKFLPAVVVAYLLLMATNYLVHGIWLRPVYDLYENSWRPLEQQVAKMWILWIGQLIFTVMFAWVYTRGVEEKAWIAQGIRYGAVVTLFVVVPYTLSEYVVYRVPYRLALTWMGTGLVQMVLLGLVVAYFLRKPPAKPAVGAPTQGAAA